MYKDGMAAEFDAVFSVIQDTEFANVDFTQLDDAEIVGAAFARYESNLQQIKARYSEVGVFGDADSKREALRAARFTVDGSDYALSPAAMTFLIQAVPLPVDVPEDELLQRGVQQATRQGLHLMVDENDQLVFVSDRQGTTFASYGISQEKLDLNSDGLWRYEYTRAFQKRLSSHIAGSPKESLNEVVAEVVSDSYADYMGLGGSSSRIQSAILQQIEDGTVELKFDVADASSDRPMTRLRVVGDVGDQYVNLHVATFDWGEVIGDVPVRARPRLTPAGGSRGRVDADQSGSFLGNLFNSRPSTGGIRFPTTGEE